MTRTNDFLADSVMDGLPKAGSGIPPESLYLGLIMGEWPIVAFEEESAALSWLKTGASDGHRRHLWTVRLTDPVELRYVDPEPYLEEMPDGN
ncbi:MAG: hypothetical protein ACRDQA_22720 [Nocardioidaceae bacterium]